MGYQTEFTGRIELSRELSNVEADVINAFAEERHGGNTGGYTTPVQGYWCNIEVTKDGCALEWNGNEKTYDFDAWMQVVLDRFITPLGVVANGVIDAEGEQSGDVWRLKVVDNVVSRVKGRVVFEDAE